MRNKLHLILAIILVFSFFGKTAAQEIEFNLEHDLKFFNYLIENKLFDDAIQQTKLFDYKSFSASQKDSVLFFKGFSFYNLNQNDSSNNCFKKLTESSVFYSKSRLLSYKGFISENRISDAKDVLLSFTPENRMISETKKLNLAGIALIERNYLEYEKQIKSLEMLSSKTELTVQKLDENYNQLVSQKKKSPFVAGMLSGIIPGLGKVYAGKPRHGLSSFLVTTTFGIQAYEFYKKEGIKSTGFYVFGTLFTAFYIGNIWGSAISVKVIQEEYAHEINNKILLDIRIPIDSIIK